MHGRRSAPTRQRAQIPHAFVDLKQMRVRLATPIQMIFGAPFAENVPMPAMGRKNAPNWIALSFSRSAESTSSGTSSKKPKSGASEPGQSSARPNVRIKTCKQ